VRPESVFDVLRKRVATGSRDDGHRLGLVVEGGAMRGVYTAGSLLGLHAMGASAAFDDVYATSAGAVNAAYFLSGSGHLGADSYYRVLCDRRFLDWRRPWKIVDIDFLVDEVFTRLRPMRTDAVMTSSTRFWIAVADFSTACSRLLCAQTAGHPLLELLRAAVALPIGYNRLVPLGEMLAFDAGLCNPFPLREAIADGCSHILVLLSRPQAHLAKPSSLWQTALFNLCFARGRASISRSLADAWKVGTELRALATGRSRAADADVAIATICPIDGVIRDTMQHAAILREELIKCARGTVRALSRGEERLDEWIRNEQI
jgi:predicted patatin/cPLA2 family phospholipase